MRPRLGLVAATASLMLAGATLALASSFGAPETIPGSAPGNSGAAAVAVEMDAAGDSLALFVDDWADAAQLKFSDRPAGGAWSAAEPIGGHGAQPPHGAIAPQLEMNAAGAAVAYYTGNLSPGHRLAYRGAEGELWEPAAAPFSGQLGVANPRVAIDAAGNAIVAWKSVDEAPNPDLSLVQVSYKDALSAAWDAPVTVASKQMNSPEQELHFFDVTFLGGQPAVLFADGDSGDAFVRLRSAGGTWNVTKALPATEDWDAASGPGETGRLVEGAAGDAVVLWKEWDTSDSEVLRSALRVATAPAGSGFPTIPATLQTLEQSGYSTLENLALTRGPAGDVLATWLDENGDHVKAARHPAGGGWSAAETLSGSGASDPRGAIGGDGNHVVSWRVVSPGLNYAAVASSATAPWGAPQLMHPPRSSAYKPGAPTLAAGKHVIAGFAYLNDLGALIPQAAMLTGGPSSTATATATATATPPPATTPAPSPTATPQPLAVGRAKLTCRRSAKRRSPCRMIISFEVNRSVQARLTVFGLKGGKARRLGTLTRTVAAGVPRLLLPARLKGRRLGKGRYRVVLAIAGAPSQVVRGRVR